MNLMTKIVLQEEKLIKEVYRTSEARYIEASPFLEFPKVDLHRPIPIVLIPLKTTNLTPGIITAIFINN